MDAKLDDSMHQALQDAEVHSLNLLLPVIVTYQPGSDLAELEKHGLKIQHVFESINALSGGEKALSAVALLAAILSSNPSPFIVLDEVDAALDDENSTRFCKVLKRLSAHSQVIIITHNQETMQSAANIFGVTTGQKGDSEILQLALQQASGMAQS